MLSQAFEKKIDSIMEEIGDLESVLITDLHMDLIRGILIKHLGSVETGAALEQAVVDEVEYMINDGLFYELEEELNIIDTDRIETEFKQNIGVIADSIVARVNFHDVINEEIKAHLVNKD
ncbi:MAG: hypothetical protein BWY74_00011 [Firmicutes bacterium ADurb.Bin419]|nr:MAG: hypothetical protein BWY74_00011 [Firmicutes bacterium ADurb.Bin419]